jgi:hypothetical protein
MQPETWYVHVRDRTCRIKPRENVAQLGRVFRNHAPLVVVLVKTLQSFVAERPDHRRSYCVT